ncbi:hypothetical protein F8M41_005263 [Gigaspora margarita]|uniref:Uncharacterized protein n=1 Tax=Gigaspora margarita TaxID=4874 RepID=A0A8H4B4M1_GIGMA|nr:hypothetical protein F8M41_005263 [Gigaspora margarita]
MQTSPSVQSIELNSQDNDDPIDLNVQTFELSNKDINNPINPDFQTRALLSDLQINTTTQTHPGIYGFGNSQTHHGIYGPRNSHPNAFKKNPMIGSINS